MRYEGDKWREDESDEGDVKEAYYETTQCVVVSLGSEGDAREFMDELDLRRPEGLISVELEWETRTGEKSWMEIHFELGSTAVRDGIIKEVAEAIGYKPVPTEIHGLL